METTQPSDVVPPSPVAQVEQILRDNGWEPCGARKIPGNIVRIPGNRFVAGSYSERQRWRRGDQRVTVGQRTTCLYRVKNGQATGFVNFSTKDDMEAIRVALANATRPT